MGNEQLKFI